MKNIKSYKIFETEEYVDLLSPRFFHEIINTLEEITLELQDINYKVIVGSSIIGSCDMIFVKIFGNLGQDNFLFDECLLRIKDYMNNLGFSIHLESINRNYDNILDISFYNKEYELVKPGCPEWKKKQL